MTEESNQLTRLIPQTEVLSVAEYAAGLEFSPSRHETKPWLFCNFAMTVDGQATIDGRSGTIAGKADSELLMALRNRVDAVMVGAGTLRAERYGRIVPDPKARELRAEMGLSEDPIAVIVSGHLNLPWEIPLFSDLGGPVIIFTNSRASVPETSAELTTVRQPGDGVDLAEMMIHLREDLGVKTVLCEGGPTLHGHLWREGLVDELFVTVGPRLAGDEGPEIVSGSLERPIDLELVGLLKDSEGSLMCRYVRSGGGQ